MENKELIAPKVTSYPQALEWNFEASKKSVEDMVADYVGLIVTDSNVKEMEREARDLTKMRTGIDRFEKTVVTELRKPIEQFRKQCTELRSVVASAENPLRQQLDVYEVARREAAADRARKRFGDECVALGVREEYQNFICELKFLNRGQSWKDTEEAVKRQANGCLTVQKEEDARKELMTLRKETLGMYAEKISREMGLATPVTVEGCSLPLLEMPIEEAKKVLADNAQRRAAIESAAKQKQEQKEEPSPYMRECGNPVPAPKKEEKQESRPILITLDVVLRNEKEGYEFQACLDRLSDAGVEFTVRPE